MGARLLWLDGREPRTDAATLNPEMAQFHLWLAQAQRDHNNISDNEMGKMEGSASIMAKRSRMMYNPFTGEIRPYDDIEDCYDPDNILHQIAKGRG